MTAFEDLSGRLSAVEASWAECARRMGEAGRRTLASLTGTEAGKIPLGRGGGGDVTITLDKEAEEAMLSVLRDRAPEPYSLVAEEAGIDTSDDAEWTVLLDPVDGSLNAKRGLEPFAGVIAVARGTTLGSVAVGYTQDYARMHRYLAAHGKGLAASRGFGGMTQVSGPIKSDPSIEVVLVEAGSPWTHEFKFADLALGGVPDVDSEVRVRQVGSLALSLCNVGLGVADVLLAPSPCRSVDVAAGLLFVREAGGGAASLDGAELFDQPLDLEKRSPFVAWRSGVDGQAVTEAALQVFGG